MSEREVKIRIKAEDGATPIFEKLHHQLGELRQGFGRRSVLGELGEMARLGGPIAGIFAAFEALKVGYEHIKEARETLYQVNATRFHAENSMLDEEAKRVNELAEYWQKAGEQIDKYHRSARILSAPEGALRQAAQASGQVDEDVQALEAEKNRLKREATAKKGEIDHRSDELGSEYRHIKEGSLIYYNAEEKKRMAEIRGEMDKLVKEYDGVDKTLASKIGALDQKIFGRKELGAAENSELAARQMRERDRAAEEGNFKRQKIQDEAAQAEVESRLRIFGLGFQAEISQMRFQAEQRKKELDREAREEIEQRKKLGEDVRDKVLARTAVEKGAIDRGLAAQVAAAQRQHQLEEAQKQFRTEASLRELLIKSLETEAKASGHAMDAEVDRAKNAQEFAERRRQLFNVIISRDATTAQRFSAFSLFAQTGPGEQLANATDEIERLRRAGPVAGGAGSETHLLQGRTFNRGTDSLTQHTADIKAKLDNVKTTLENLPRKLAEALLPGIGPIIGGAI